MAAPKGHPNLGKHLVGLQQRSRHLGYDCYVCGPMTGERRVRLVLRPHAMPARLPEDVRAFVPREVWWPTAVHSEAHACIDAIYTLDTATLRRFVKQFPEHRFGFEDFIHWAERWRAAASDRAVQEGYVPPSSPPVRQAAENPRRFPTWSTHSDFLRESTLGPVTLRLFIAHFGSKADPVLRVDVHPLGITPNRVSLLTRIYADLVEPYHEVREHYPGRYDAYGVPRDALKAILGTGMINRRITPPEPPKRPTEVGPREQARRTADAARTLYALGAGEEAFAPHLAPTGTSR